MRAGTLTTGLATFVLLAASVARGQAAPTVIRHVTVIDVVAGARRSDLTVVIAGDRVRQVGRADAVPTPRGARLVDGRGKFLVPGLWDMHVHLGNATEAALPVLVASGVTGVRDMGSPRLEPLRRWHAEGRAGTRVAPRVVAAGPMLTGGAPREWQLAVRDPANAPHTVDSLAAAGVDFVKVTQDLDRDTYFAVADAARARGLPLAGHLPVTARGDGFAVSGIEAAEAGQRSLEHMHGIPFAFGPGDSALVAALRRHGTWVTPTLTAYRARAHVHELAAARDDPRLARLAPAFRAHWDAQVRDFPPDSRAHAQILAWRTAAVGALHRSGVPLLAGTDLGFPYVHPGDVVAELELFVRAGLSPLDALRTATINPARYLGLEAESGSVEAGKLADLVLLDADPLDDVGNLRRVRAVVLHGRFLDRAQLGAALPTFRVEARR